MRTSTQSAVHGRGHRMVQQAWWSLLLFPPAFIAAFVIGEGIPSILGYSQPSLDSTPWWLITLAVVPALLVFAAPLLVTAHLSRKAMAAGEGDGRLPLVVAGVVVGAFVAVNLLSGLAQLVF